MNALVFMYLFVLVGFYFASVFLRIDKRYQNFFLIMFILFLITVLSILIFYTFLYYEYKDFHVAELLDDLATRTVVQPSMWFPFHKEITFTDLVTFPIIAIPSYITAVAMTITLYRLGFFRNANRLFAFDNDVLKGLGAVVIIFFIVFIYFSFFGQEIVMKSNIRLYLSVNVWVFVIELVLIVLSSCFLLSIVENGRKVGGTLVIVLLFLFFVEIAYSVWNMNINRLLSVIYFLLIFGISLFLYNKNRKSSVFFLTLTIPLLIMRVILYIVYFSDKTLDPPAF